MMRKESLKLTWQDLHPEALQSSLLNSAGVQLQRINPELSGAVFLVCFAFSGFFQICKSVSHHV